MDKSIVSIMQQACIFAVIAQMIFYFRPNDTYEKYLKLLIGMILIAVLFIPMLEVFHLADTDNFQKQIDNYEQNIQKVYEQMYEGNVDFKQLGSQIEGNENQLLAIEEEVKTRINNIKGINYTAESIKITGVTYLDGANDFTEMMLEIKMKKNGKSIVEIGIEPVNVEESDENQNSENDRLKELLEEELAIEKERMIIKLNE